ncbi:MAG TPA: porin family protein [Ferruginibacter sp.]|jgi:hypothetical protein|nr:porin family protein [Ferruginibacter sp.]
MKKILCSTIIVVFAFSAAYSQSFDFGIKAGANINKISGEAFSNEFSFGYHAGAFANISLGKHWALQPEVLFSQVNVDTATSTDAIYNPDLNKISHINLSYLSIPLLLEYKLSKGIALQAGPQYSILLNPGDSYQQNGQNAFKMGDFSLLGGLEIKIRSVHVYGRYAVGLSNIHDIANEDQWKSQSIQVGLGLSLF